MSHRIEFSPAASRQFRDLEKLAQVRILRTIEALQETPRPPSCQKLECEEPLYRIRVGDYRIIYEVHDTGLLVLVLKVGHRRDVYR